MAALLFHVKSVPKTLLEFFSNKSIGFVRNASKKCSRSSHFGCKKQSNSIVKKSTILFHQPRLQVIPGLNVGLGKVAELYSKVPGRVIISCEKPNFKPDERIVQISFPYHPPGYRKYIHVIPQPLHRRFKLVEKV